MNVIASAPRDGRRILAQCTQYHYNRSAHGYRAIGRVWKEIWFVDGQWEEWCGNERTRSTSKPEPIYWIPLPSMDKPHAIKYTLLDERHEAIRSVYSEEELPLPFGVRGRDFDESFHVIQTFLFDAPPATPDDFRDKLEQYARGKLKDIWSDALAYATEKRAAWTCTATGGFAQEMAAQYGAWYLDDDCELMIITTENLLNLMAALGYEDHAKVTEHGCPECPRPTEGE